MRKNFEQLYQVAMCMGDNLLDIEHLPVPKRIDKLNEEYNELLIELDAYTSLKCNDKPTFAENQEFLKAKIKGEAGDVLFVLLHLCHTLGITPTELLHATTTKMLKRLADPNYIGAIKHGG